MDSVDHRFVRVKGRGASFVDVISQLNNCIIITEPDYRIVFWNKGAQELLGREEEEVMGESLESILNIVGDGDLLFCLDNRDSSRIYPIKMPNGEVKTIKVSLTAVRDEKGNIEKLVIAADDVGELVKARDQAEQANKAKSEFLANLSHEMRTALVGIVGFCEILSREKQHHRGEESIDTIQYCAQELLGLVNNVLDLSKIETKQVEVVTKVFNLGKLIKQLIAYIQPELDKRGLDIQLEIDNEVPENMVGDESKIKQVLRNLMTNAVKYTERGYIKVEVSRHNSVLARDSSAFPLKISVKDTGIGVPLEEAEDIFKPFSRAANLQGSEYEGTGLGLAISKQLVEIMGGNIWYEPNRDQGSVFSFTLPVQVYLTRKIQEGKTSYEIGQREVKPASVPTVMLVEDTGVNRKLIKYMLEDIGYNVIGAKNGEECIDLLRKNYPDIPDIILMDMQMPVMDGYEATRIIRQSPDYSNVPIVALTAYAMTNDIDKCIQAGCDYYLSKPFTREQLFHVINRCFGLEAKI